MSHELAVNAFAGKAYSVQSKWPCKLTRSLKSCELTKVRQLTTVSKRIGELQPCVIIYSIVRYGHRHSARMRERCKVYKPSCMVYKQACDHNTSRC